MSRYGVFVIETKHYSGWLFGDAKSKQWTQVIYGAKHRFQNPLHQNYKHIKAVQELLDFLAPEHVIGLVVFTGRAEFKTDTPSGIFSLESVIEHLKGFNEELLTENRMQFCVGRLEVSDWHSPKKPMLSMFARLVTNTTKIKFQFLHLAQQLD